MDSVSPSILSALHDLTARVGALEQRLLSTREPIRRLTKDQAPEQAQDVFALRMLCRALALSFTDTRFVRCPCDYYDQSLEWRCNFLQACTTSHLTKSIILQNTRHTGVDDISILSKSKYVCVILSYTCRLDTDLLRKIVRQSIDGEMRCTSGFNYRVAEDGERISGYVLNGVTPLGMKHDMPVIVDERVGMLQPDVIWLGGGDVNMKWRVHVSELIEGFGAKVAKITVPIGA